MRTKLFERNLLYSLISFGFLVRIYHHYNWRIWGSDSGEYLYLTRHLVENGEMLTEGYIGWGRAYTDFQGMQILAGSVGLLTGMDYHQSLLWFIPLMSALAIPALFMIGKKLVGFLPALFGCAFYSVTFAVVFANSHPMPGGLAEPLGFVLLYAWLKCLEFGKYDGVWSVLLIFTLGGLLMTHHFTLLLMMAAMVGILVVEITAGNEEIAKPGILGIAFISVIISAYWLVYAGSFSKMLEQSAFGFLPESIPVTLVMALIPFVCIAILWAIKDKLPFCIAILWAIKDKLVLNVDHSSFLKRIIFAFFASLIVILLALWKGVPGTEIPVGMDAVPYLAVNLAWITLVAAPTFVLSKKYGWFIFGWMLPILGLAAIGTITGSHLLIAYRHAPYLMAPLAFMAGVGFQYLIKGFKPGRRPAIAYGFTLLFLGCAFGAYPPPSVMGGFQEGTNDKEFDAILWTQFTEDDSLVVSDHRLSSLIFGLTETNASWENGAEVITGDTEQAIEAGKAISTPQAGVKQVSYVMLSEEMQKGVALLQWDPAEELTGEAKTKFTDNDQFPIWFDNGDTIIMRMNQ